MSVGSGGTGIQTSAPVTRGQRLLQYLTPALLAPIPMACVAYLFLWFSGSYAAISEGLGMVPMAPFTILLFLLLSAALLLEHRRPASKRINGLVRAAAAFTLAVSILVLAHFFEVFPVDIESIITEASLSSSGFLVGRMSPITGILFATTAVSLFISTSRQGNTNDAVIAADFLSAIVLLVSLVIALGYRFDAPLFYGGQVIPVALSTGVGFFLFAAAQLANQPKNLLYRFLASPSVNAQICRALIPLAALLVIAGSYLEELIRKALSPDMYATLAVAATVVRFAVIGAVVMVVSRRIDGRIVQQAAALRESEQRWRSLEENFRNSFDNSPLGIRIVSEEGDLLYANRAVLEMYGCRDFQELRATPAKGLYMPQSYDEHLRRKEMRKLGTPAPSDYDINIVRRNDGAIRNLSVSRREVTWNGRRQYQVIYQDITERKKMEAALEISAQNLRNTLESQALGCRIYDGRGNLLFSNLALARLYGYGSVEELNAVEKQRRLTQKSYGESEQRIKKAESNGGFPKRYELEIVRKDGEVRSLEAFSNQIYWDGKKRTQIIYQDVTEHKKADEQIRAAAEEWQTTFDSISEPIAILSKDFRLIRVNKAFAESLDMDPNDVTGRTCYALLHGTSGPAANCPVIKTLESGKPSRVEFFEPHLERHLEFTASPVFNDAGEVTAFVHVTRDVTEQKRMAEQLMQTDRLASIGLLASGIAHELNNPLTSVIGFSDILMEKDLPDDIRKDMAIINTEAQRTARIVKGLLTFARKQSNEKVPVNVADIIGGVLSLRAYEHQVTNIAVRTDSPPDAPYVVGNNSQLQQVFINIIVNAEQAMLEAHGRGTLSITTRIAGDTVRISFADDGPGISPENMRKLFNPFFTTKEVGKGTGLGLSICHGIVTEHGGQIRAESMPGRGATFIIELPVFKNAPPQAA